MHLFQQIVTDIDSHGQTINNNAETVKLETAPEGHGLIANQVASVDELHTALKALLMKQFDRLKSLREIADKADQLSEEVLNVIQKQEESVEELDAVPLQQKMTSIKVNF